MSALGQKQTCAAQKIMSALPPKADMCGAPAHVCFLPEADSCTATNPVQTRHRQMQAAEGLAVQFGGIHPVVG
ncbi:MAG: hypothetical protein WCF29_26285, partial [Pseudolabrys sp.]